MNAPSARPARRTPAERAAETRALAEAVPPLLRALVAELPTDRAGERLRRRLDAILALPAKRRIAELPEMLATIESERVRAGESRDEVHEALRVLVHGRHPVLLRDASLAQWLEGPERRTAMLSWLLRDGAERLERAQGALAGDDAERERLRTELARLESEHRALRRELEHHRALADVGLLAAGVVHDFNNLLHAITGHAAIARAAAGERAREPLDQIVDAAQRAGELTHRLLQWVRHEHSVPEPVDASALASEVLDLLAPSAPARVLLVRRLASGLPLVLADPVELRRVLLNLVLNAWQAIGTASGEVVVRTGLAEGRIAGVFLEVADDGRGMDADTCARAFEPFFSTRPDGSGLGLASAREIVERMQGTIEVWSEPGRGARFRVTLPAHSRGARS